MAFPTDEIFLGPASFGKRGENGECDGIIWHTTEAAGTSRDDALATHRFQLTHAGSYNFIIYDGGIILTVPYLEASGGTNPYSNAWAPQRYPFLKQQLPLRAYNDPNGWQLNVAFSGRTSKFRKGLMPANMIETAAMLTLWVQAQEWGADVLVHSGHMHWQTNRSDPSQLVLDSIQQRVIELSEYQNPFVDIDDPKYAAHKQNIIDAAELGIFSVPANKQFQPDGLLTRAQAATVIMRALRTK